MKAIKVAHDTKMVETTIKLVASKSECNRALIINALTGNACTLHNVSTARDSVTMQALLSATSEVLDVIDAGTTMRFLTAYTSLQPGTKILTGTHRMCERPIGILVDALRELGATIQYEKNEGFPPLRITGPLQQKTASIQIRGDVSSQFISALLLIAPNLPLGLELHLTGTIGSRPYINMTLQMMADFGIAVPQDWDRTIRIPAKPYTPATFYIESDWSGASYWYSIAALSNTAQIELVGLKKHSLQGDAVISKLMEPLGVQTTYKEHSVVLTKRADFVFPKQLAIDFASCPDIAQTLAVVCAARKVNLQLTGVESLKVKETDRIAALQNELLPFGARLVNSGPETYDLFTDGFTMPQKSHTVATYLDHRMAMAFAPLGLIGPVQLDDKDVVVKSYPSFWDDLSKAGFMCTT